MTMRLKFISRKLGQGDWDAATAWGGDHVDEDGKTLKGQWLDGLLKMLTERREALIAEIERRE